MIAQELEVSLHMAFVEARQQRHEFITVEHLLLALLDNPSAAEVLRACSANIDDLRKSLANFIKDNTPQVAGTEEVDTQPTLGFQRVIQRAIMHVQSTGNGKKEVTGANVLVAIFGEKDSHAVYYLHQQGVTRLDVVNFIAHGIKKSDPQRQPKAQKATKVSKKRAPRQKKTKKPLLWSNSPKTSTNSPRTARSIHSLDANTRSSAPSKSCAADVKTTHSWWARLALVKLPSQKA
jgi:ATP-dependent Clp protease ATP-binding subunit ClpA